MYVQSHLIDKQKLFQGDIIKKIHLLGAININSINYSTDLNKNVNGWAVLNPPIYSDAVVISHSCEISKENGLKFTSIILAPLRDVKSASSKEKIEELKNSNIISEGIEFSFLKYFYLEPNPELEYSQGAIIDFSKCFSLRNQSFDYIVERKFLQLEGSIVSKMALKLSLYFYRNEFAKLR